MAVVIPHLKKLVVPMPRRELYEVLDNAFVTKTLNLPNGDELLVIPHCFDSLRILRNMDINVDGCDMFDWYYVPPRNIHHPDWEVWWWQLETASFLASNPRAFCTSTPRTGKTLSTLMAIDYTLRNIGGRAVIIAPLTVAAEGEWAKTIREWFPHRKVVLVHGNREEDLKTPADIYLINPDGVKIVQDQLEEMARRGIIKIAVVDELTEYANPKSDRWVAANTFMKYLDYRWGLTGTPGKPEKIYGQVKLINPVNVPKYFSRWRDMVSVKITTFKWVPKEGHEEVIKEAMSPCIRFNKDDLMSIPIPQVITEYVELSEAQQKVTSELIEELRTTISSEEINATTASTLAQKLLQVAGGVVKTEDGYVTIDATPKLTKLAELLRRTPRKKVIYSSFTGINNMLVEFVHSLGMTCEKIDGSVMGLTRSRILNDFLNATDPHVLVCHPRTTAFGVELASADMIICYGTPMTGAFMYKQLFERLSSSRQEADETFVVHLAAGKQDKVSFANLSQNVSIEQNIVSIFTRELL